jgi:hypothetical protein
MPSSRITVLAYEAGLKPFDPVASFGTDAFAESQFGESTFGSLDQKSHRPKTVGDMAAQLLAGRNAYFDMENRRRFGTRVHTLEVAAARLVLGAVESASPANPVGGRKYRAVIFDCDGVVRFQTANDRVHDSQDAATVELQYELSKLREPDVLAQIVERHLKGLTKRAASAEKVLTVLQKARGGP